MKRDCYSRPSPADIGPLRVTATLQELLKVIGSLTESPRRFKLPIAVADLEVAGHSVRAKVVELEVA